MDDDIEFVEEVMSTSFIANQPPPQQIEVANSLDSLPKIMIKK
jgi:hypothetical protein